MSDKVKLAELSQKTQSSLDSTYQLLNKQYLATLNNEELLPLVHNESIHLATDIRIFRIERIILENKQSMLESLTATYATLGTAGHSVFLFLNSDGKETTIYLGTKGKAKKSLGNAAGKLLKETINGHFSGTQLVSLNGNEIEELVNKLDESDKNITAVTSVPSLSTDEREYFMQGLEHFIDAAEGRIYQALILAEPVNTMELDLIQQGYEGVATQLSPLLKTTLSYGENESDSVGLSISENISQSLGKSLGLTETRGTSESHSESTGTSVAYSMGGNYSRSITGGVSIDFASISSTSSIGVFASKTNTKSTTFTTTTGSNESQSQSQTTSTTDSYGTTTGRNVNRTLGTSKQRSIEFTNKTIELLLKKVDHNLERIDEARRYGGWNSAAYFISEDLATSQALASMFFSLMRGNTSSAEDFAFTIWNKQDPNKTKEVLTWLKNFSHPRVSGNFVKGVDIPFFTPAVLVSGKEMAIQLGLPRRSTSTVSVLEGKSFGRKIQVIDAVGSVNSSNKDKPKVELGKIFHLWSEKAQVVNLDLQTLSSHIFVTGSTGSGKSNTVYQLLDQFNKNEVKFMVIEPAKGEYKNVFGHREDVAVFGTNPKQAKLLKINPFKFPAEVHILEHIDRLIEIFNVCWPMYAAMPAVLKDAILSAYEASGWNLISSTTRTPNRFPSFVDLLHQLEIVIEKSNYSSEMKSNYSGALATRIKSLTNGLNGQIFNADELDNSLLFDENVIIDLSRVGSQETKSLIMGILIMRLSEHRMATATGMNEPLKHITVLEEAHNILKRTSTEQSSEGSNVAGKSVEMLSNAIAEMRTYGEGFIIADQSPNAVDISAIRNTNTKIIMRLPDESDRRLAGKAAGVNDEQLEEIAKLPKGIAVVYQNNWLEPILCKIAYFDSEEKPYQYVANEEDEKKIFNEHLIRFLLHKQLENESQFDINVLKKGVNRFSSSARKSSYLHKLIQHYEQKGNSPFWDCPDKTFKILLDFFDLQNGVTQRIKELQSRQDNIQEKEVNELIQLIIENLHHNFENTRNIEGFIHNTIRKNLL
ncbi:MULTISPECIES: ATP-binding protein [unclassified Avibacterium]|uniref:ATP-binding protein n=1 Tax=unclassified Avibacterium TaxID=2685287 RepID=UPI00202699FD|nr:MULTISPECIES: ATP-binding protein [unclassified Avibacterium]MCW9699524.1 Flp pilus assembly complex ATPase component TadA [Avibacterium sp. 20-129]MCW9733541.1 Flp pilus assembly complex ATPase component TadA [Avibacterium sp. 20-15]URL03399.1 Flp pilus assembly complex ATPase component TadA [Avibacterium sp. 20-132]URL06127.1 Flp pilus assembly complex ATPase component TadA [Avibacterium sp. 21-595]